MDISITIFGHTSMTAPGRRSGFSLVELLISIGLFSVVLLAMVMIENTGRKMDRSLQNNDEALREAVVASAWLQQELSHALVLGTTDPLDPTVRLIYRLPAKTTTGEPETNGRGNIRFAPEEYRLRLTTQGRLFRAFGSEERNIAQFGEGGLLDFAFEGAGPDVSKATKFSEAEYVWRDDQLSAKILTVKADGGGKVLASYSLELDFFLRNQYPN